MHTAPTPGDVLFWRCPIQGHEATVEWVGDTARCSTSGCRMTSKVTGDLAERAEAEQRNWDLQRLQNLEAQVKAARTQALDTETGTPDQLALIVGEIVPVHAVHAVITWLRNQPIGAPEAALATQTTTYRRVAV